MESHTQETALTLVATLKIELDDPLLELGSETNQSDSVPGSLRMRFFLRRSPHGRTSILLAPDFGRMEAGGCRSDLWLRGLPGPDVIASRGAL